MFAIGIFYMFMVVVLVWIVPRNFTLLTSKNLFGIVYKHLPKTMMIKTFLWDVMNIQQLFMRNLCWYLAVISTGKFQTSYKSMTSYLKNGKLFNLRNLISKNKFRVLGQVILLFW